MRARTRPLACASMCGRFTISLPPEQIEEAFDATGAGSLPPGVRNARYNVAPTQDVVIVKRAKEAAGEKQRAKAAAGEKQRVLEAARWGLAGAAKMINARQETVFEKQPFASAVRARRCLVPADSFFEWKKLSPGPRGLKQPMRIRLKDGALFAMAGIFAKWQSPAGEWIETCSILTTAPNDLVQPVHDRMPVILGPDSWDLWLDPTIKDREPLEHLFLPFPAEQMVAEPVSARVNSVENDDAGCIEVVEPLVAPKTAEQMGFDFS
jgi:putative SOS response-associated peptidase YedK